jgi:hypothetical protein
MRTRQARQIRQGIRYARALVALFEQDATPGTIARFARYAGTRLGQRAYWRTAAKTVEQQNEDRKATT